MNPYLIIALLIAWAVSVAGSAVVGDHYGASNQKVADQTQFDKINQQTADQKAEANNKYRALVMDKIALIVANEKLISDGDKRYEEAITAANDRAVKYADRGLRFATTKSAGLGSCGDRTGSASAKADPPGPTYVELPGQIREGLRGLQLDGDRLIEAYRKAYDWIEQMKCNLGTNSGTN